MADNGYYTPAAWDEEDALAQSFSTPGMSLSSSPTPAMVASMAPPEPTLPQVMGAGFLADSIKRATELQEGYTSQLAGLRQDFSDANSIDQGTASGTVSSALLPTLVALIGGGRMSDVVSAAGAGVNNYVNNLAKDEVQKKAEIADKIKFTQELLGSAVKERQGLIDTQSRQSQEINLKTLTGDVVGTLQWEQKQNAEMAQKIATAGLRTSSAQGDRELSDSEAALLGLPPGTKLSIARLKNQQTAESGKNNRSSEFAGLAQQRLDRQNSEIQMPGYRLKDDNVRPTKEEAKLGRIIDFNASNAKGALQEVVDHLKAGGSEADRAKISPLIGTAEAYLNNLDPNGGGGKTITGHELNIFINSRIPPLIASARRSLSELASAEAFGVDKVSQLENTIKEIDRIRNNYIGRWYEPSASEPEDLQTKIKNMSTEEIRKRLAGGS